MSGWRATIDTRLPYWEDVAAPLAALGNDEFPATAELNRLLPASARNQQGTAIQFVPAETIPGVSYEEHIFSSGQVSTRSKHWHDLFNAMIWMTFPRLKSAMNTLHHASMHQSTDGARGRHRDALTLFDECGVIYVSADQAVLEALAQRDWSLVFAGDEGSWRGNRRMHIVGHAMLEKLLQPYKAMTANALLLHVPASLLAGSRETVRARLDTALAEEMLAGRGFSSSADLSPLPLMGIPGWWPGGEQDESYYADKTVFRPPPEKFQPAGVFSIG
jgi:hypothetical protein